jgi:tellurium resistance protein TerD
MNDDFFDTRFETSDVELSDNKIGIGDEVNLKEKDPTMTKVNIGVGWDVNAFDSDVIDLDVSAILLDKDNMTRIDEDFVFYNNPESQNAEVKHKGDSRTGAGDGDDEIIFVDLNALPFDIMRVLFVLSIYKGNEKEQHLDQVQGAFIRLVNADNRTEITRYDLSDDIEHCPDTAFLCAALDREGPKWHFRPIGEPVAGGLREAAMRYGLIIADQ